MGNETNIEVLRARLLRAADEGWKSAQAKCEPDEVLVHVGIVNLLREAASALSLPADGGEAVATVCLVGEDRYGGGHFIELQVQTDDGVTFRIGDKLYTRPAPVTDAVRALPAEDDDGMPVGYADWYNATFSGQHVDTARDHACERAWRAALASLPGVGDAK